MARYVFPALIAPDADGFSVSFPDLPACYTSGADLADAIVMAGDALALVLVHMEDEGAPIPAPSADVPCAPGVRVSLVCADTDAYRRRIGSRAVKKTLTIPQWMNDAAERQGVNFSQVLQDALRALLGGSGQ